MTVQMKRSTRSSKTTISSPTGYKLGLLLLLYILHSTSTYCFIHHCCRAFTSISSTSVIFDSIMGKGPGLYSDIGKKTRGSSSPFPQEIIGSIIWIHILKCMHIPDNLIYYWTDADLEFENDSACHFWMNIWIHISTSLFVHTRRSQLVYCFLIQLCRLQDEMRC